MKHRNQNVNEKPNNNDLNLSRRQVLLSGVAAVAAASFPQAIMANERVSKSATSVTQFVEVGGRKLAYRSVGQGKPLVLCHRFRGVLGLWDPAFIDALVVHGNTHDSFDYEVNGTRVVCNPRGYVIRGYAENKSFNSTKVVEI